MAVVNPFHQSIISEVELENKKEAFNKIQKAYNLILDKKRKLSIKERVKILSKFKLNILGSKDLLIKTAISEGGKPYKDTLIEFDRALSTVDIAIRELGSFVGEIIPMDLGSSSNNRYSFSIFEPRGVALAISAFNHPINLIMHQVVPALAVGCPVIIKPALKTPLSAKIIVEALYQTGLDPSWVQYLLVENDCIQELIADSRIGFMSFVGSSNIGWYLRSKLAAGAHCNLEHGGVASLIVDQEIDITKICEGLTRACFYHAGQVCVSTQKIFVHEKILDKFLPEFINQTKNLVVGDPLDTQTDVGPVINSSEINRIDSWVQQAQKNGSEILCGGKRLDRSLYAPTVLFGEHKDIDIFKEEVFGPVAVVSRFSNLEEVIKQINNSDYCFQVGIFSPNIHNIFQVTRECCATHVIANDHTTFRVDWMPFGGHKKSGLGRSGVGYAMRDLIFEKQVTLCG